LIGGSISRSLPDDSIEMGYMKNLISIVTSRKKLLFHTPPCEKDTILAPTYTCFPNHFCDIIHGKDYVSLEKKKQKPSVMLQS
jgi:hypothetical protein